MGYYYYCISITYTVHITGNKSDCDCRTCYTIIAISSPFH